MKKLTIKEITERVRGFHGTSVTIDKNTYKNTYTKAKFIDKDYGEWWAYPKDVIRGHGHMRRGKASMVKKQTKKIEEVKKILHEKHNGLVTINEATYKGTNKRAILIDDVYGEWKAVVSNILRGNCHPKRVKENRKKTNLIKYGHENVFASEKIKKKIINTNLKKYGVEYPQQSEKIREKVKKRNLDKYGYEYTLQVPFIREQIVKTNLKKYGVKCTAQDPTTRMKQAKSANNSTVLRHWFSGEEIICQGSYERNAIYYFNNNKIDYNWQVQTFTMPSGKRYTPDCYLPNEDKWIEIKGYFWDDAQEKWEWFHSEYPNSELWNEKKLRNMGIIE